MSTARTDSILENSATDTSIAVIATNIVVNDIVTAVGEENGPNNFLRRRSYRTYY